MDFLIMNEIDALKEEIDKTKVVLSESQKYFQENPDDYSARLLLISTENHLTDLLKRLESLAGQN